MNNYGYIYKTTDLVTNKLYVGQKKGVFNPNYLGSGLIIKRVINKRGRSNFKLEVVVYAADKEKLNELEKFYIAEYRRIFGKDTLYNITDGGNFGYDSSGKNNPMYGSHRCGKDNPAFGIHHSPESIERTRIGLLEYYKVNSSYKRTKEINDKTGVANKKNWQNPEYREKQLKANLARWTPELRKKHSELSSGEKNGMFGKTYEDVYGIEEAKIMKKRCGDRFRHPKSETTKKKISEAKIKLWADPEFRARMKSIRNNKKRRKDEEV